MFTGITGRSEGVEETQRHRDAVIEKPLFRVGDVDRVHHLGDDSLGQVSIARGPEPLDPEPTRISIGPS